MDGLYFIIVILMLIIPVIAQINITTNYSKYKKIENKKKLSGFEVARKILDANGLNDVHIVEVKGNLTDHYDPRRKVVRLSTDIFHGETIASAAVAAHECGHAIQDKENYVYLRIRSMIVPMVNVTSYVAYIFILISFFLSEINLFWVAIFLMGFSIIFQLVTLPVEFDASKRANINLNKLSLLADEELTGTEKMLKSAALTYVASLLTSILEILRLIVMFTGDRD